MLNTFLISFRLRAAYKTNGIIYSLKSIPLVRRLLPEALYASRGLKTFANVVSIILEFFSLFFWKLLYLSLLFAPLGLMKSPPADSYLHMLVFLTLIGGILNTHIFNPTRDKFYALFLMRMDPVQYTLSTYTYFLLGQLVGIGGFSLLFGRIIEIPLLACLCIPLYVVEIKTIVTAWSLRQNKRSGKAINENVFTGLTWAAVAVLLAAALVPPIFGFAVNVPFFCVLTGVLLIPGGFSLRYIWRFDRYRALYQELLRPENFTATGKHGAGVIQQQAMQKKLTADLSLTSDKQGYAYFNELFMKRHAKLLTRSARRITIIAAVSLAAAVVACWLFPDVRNAVNGMTLTFLPYFLFVMYLINRGKVITQAMFMNCDHSMLTYRFYRQPKAILSLFNQRLKYIIRINLMPAAVIALGLPLLLLISGGTNQPLNYFLLFISIIAMSIFFSVHNMVLYYLLQPYNVNLEAKSAVYGIVNYVTYFVCYIAIGREVPTLVFGTAISAFCILYAIVAYILAYRLAPKTFKLRQ